MASPFPGPPPCSIGFRIKCLSSREEGDSPFLTPIPILISHPCSGNKRKGGIFKGSMSKR